MTNSNLIGTRLGKYEIQAEIGRGGMAVVYKAHQPALERYVAIKVLPQQFTFDREFVERFLREARAAARLNHPNVVTIHEVGEADGTYYIVMEHLEGPSLTDLLRQQGPLPPQQAAQIVAQVASALDYAHRQGFVHRDVKPGNVLLNAEGVAKLTDFGVARAAQGTQLTQTGTLLGTPQYMPPEQALGLEVDYRGDIYSLGIVAYEMLAGRVPFSGDTLAVLHAHAYEPPDLNPLPGEVQEVIGKALAKDPRQRYESAGAFAQALEGTVMRAPTGRWAIEPPTRVVARPETVRPRPRAVPRWVWGLGVLVAVTLIAGILLALGSDQVVSWAVANYPWIVLALVAGVAIASRRAIASTVRGLVDAIQRQRMRRTRPTPTIPAAPVYPHPPPPPPPLVAPDLRPSAAHPSMRLKREHTGWTSRVRKRVIEDLIVHQDFERLKSFIVDSEGGRFVLTGYGRFGGTSLVRGATSRARRELQQRGLSEGALLMFYFNVRESRGQAREFEIETNEFSFGTLTTQYESAVDDPGLEALRARADRAEPFSPTSPVPLTCHFSLTTPLGTSFFRRSGLTGLFPKKPAVRDFDFTKLVVALNDFFAEGKDNSDLQEIVLRVIGSEILPSRVVIILDRIRRLETLEALAQLRLFKNERITVIAVARKEDFDQWANSEQRLSGIGFKKWYVPCVWQSGPDYVRRIEQTLLEPCGLQGSEAESVVVSLRKHLEFVGKGALGDVLEELKHPQYWLSDRRGDFYLQLDALPHPVNIQHNAWMQDVLNLNWPAILANLFAGKDMDEREDRARIGVYHLLDWIAEQYIFTKEQLLEASRAISITISDNPDVVGDVVQNLLRVLKRNRYLRLMGSQHRVVWDKSALPKPRKVKVRIPTASPEPPEPPTPLPGEVAPDRITGNQPVAPPIAEVVEPRKKKVIQISQSEDGISKKLEIAIEEPIHPTEKQTSIEGETGMSDKIKILIVFANPKGSDPLRLGEEDRIIRECIERSKNRDNLHYEIQHAVRVKDVQRALLEDNYHIVQFSGHATPSGNLAFEDETGKPKLVPQQALASLLSNFDSIECVILNACYSVSQGRLISLGVPFIIAGSLGFRRVEMLESPTCWGCGTVNPNKFGSPMCPPCKLPETLIAMDGPISDDAAKLFTRGFYDTIGAGRDYRFAYRIGCNAIAMEGYSDEATPQLLEKQLKNG